MYSQERARDDIKAVLDALKFDKAHIVGLSMGGFATLHFVASPFSDRALIADVAGCGYGAEKQEAAKFKGEAALVAKSLERGHGRSSPRNTPTARRACNSRTRTRAASRQFKKELGEHSALGSGNTQIGVQGERPSLYDLVDEMRALTVPTLILTGDEDWPCLAPAHSDEA